METRSRVEALNLTVPAILLVSIATDRNATPADPRDLFIRLELLSYELRGATFRVRECWWPTGNGGGRP
jgi:hypothetical protein